MNFFLKSSFLLPHLLINPPSSPLRLRGDEGGLRLETRHPGTTLFDYWCLELGAFLFSTSLIEVILQQPTLDGAVVKRNSSFCPQPYFLCQVEIAGKYIPCIPIAFLFKKITQHFTTRRYSQLHGGAFAGRSVAGPVVSISFPCRARAPRAQLR